MKIEQKLKYFDKKAEIIKEFDELYKQEKTSRKDLITKSKFATLNIDDEGKLTMQTANKQLQSQPQKVKE